MAAYTYQCLGCEFSFDVSHAAAETPLLACPQCGGLTERVIRQSPAVLTKNTHIKEAKETQETHDCGPGCALHNPRWDPQHLSKETAKEKEPTLPQSKPAEDD
ncbi:MAG: zinc ribbon domain-containing protein [Cyanobacteria bacterium]|nr:zinc ribbon domain-containing protein [Cyanobacteriota bacterium]